MRLVNRSTITVNKIFVVRGFMLEPAVNHPGVKESRRGRPATHWPHWRLGLLDIETSSDPTVTVEKQRHDFWCGTALANQTSSERMRREVARSQGQPQTNGKSSSAAL